MWNHEPINILPPTGQTTGYRTGDDGALKFGWQGATRFRDNGDGTIYDRATRLTWIKQPELIIPGAVGVHATNQIQVARGDWATSTAYAKADLAKDTDGSTYWVCAVAHTSAAAPTTFAADRAANPTHWRQTVWTASAANLTTPASMTWNNAIDRCLGSALGGSGLSYAGHDDWRMPNHLELYSITNRSIMSPCTYAAFFPNTQTSVAPAYSTSTTYPSDTTYSAGIRFDTGYGIARSKTAVDYVRPVRGGRRNA
jgi:hypothetical protein